MKTTATVADTMHRLENLMIITGPTDLLPEELHNEPSVIAMESLYNSCLNAFRRGYGNRTIDCIAYKELLKFERRSKKCTLFSTATYLLLSEWKSVRIHCNKVATPTIMAAESEVTYKTCNND